jgi:hypothetical protein
MELLSIQNLKYSGIGFSGQFKIPSVDNQWTVLATIVLVNKQTIASVDGGHVSLGWIRFAKGSCGFTATGLSYFTIYE